MHLGSTGQDTPAVAVAQTQEPKPMNEGLKVLGVVLTAPQWILCSAIGTPRNIICGRTGWETLGGDLAFMVIFNGAVWYGVYKLITRKG